MGVQIQFIVMRKEGCKQQDVYMYAKHRAATAGFQNDAAAVMGQQAVH